MSGAQQTAQALGGPGGSLGGVKQGASEKIRAVGQGVEEVFRMLQSIPGVDQQKLTQARAMFQQAAQLIIASVPQGGAG